ncbi:lamin tail-like protein [Pacificibacter maritimus]|uniref:Lamin tail-like protein n=1 Tax=Pacificibacter maritimus TaxID=762213 RepID=A0A3N4UC71_9RHOB|nr:Hint domain-containing protein [Pacificibacter maritimus]RPE67418.1 lamin tail-like protein [Pacificibacter maritimus]
MTASLDGIIFDQFYGDNSGGAEFDTDGDGIATQEDEFVSFTNTSGAPVDLSGWQIWSDMTGAGAPDGPQDGLYHTFPPGTVLNPGQTVYVVNEITGTPAYNMQEASEGGVESGAGGANTNFLSEGADSSSQPESVALVNPLTGEYIVLNFSATEASSVPSLSGFPGTLLMGEANAALDSGVEDQNAGASYQYNSTTGSYEYTAVTVACYAPDTLIDTPTGPRAVQTLLPGDLVHTLDHGPQPICWVRSSDHPLEATRVNDMPVIIKAGALGAGKPTTDLIVSPQHRVLVGGGGQLEAQFKTESLAPAKSLVSLPGIRQMQGKKSITWIHFACERHEVVSANACLTETLLVGPMVVKNMTDAERIDLIKVFGAGSRCKAALNGPPARPCLRVGGVRRLLAEYSKEKTRNTDKRIGILERDLLLVQ